MDIFLKETIQTARGILEQDERYTLLLDIKHPVSEGTLPDKESIRETLRSYMDFIEVANGFSLGPIVLFRYEELREMQNFLDFLPQWKEDWFFIGKILSEPVGIQLSDGGVYWFSEIPYDDHGVCLGQFPDFLRRYVFGEKFKELFHWYNEEGWHDVLIAMGLST